MHPPLAESIPTCPFDPLPFNILGSEIFPPKTWLMHPYPAKILQEDQSLYNFKHSCPRRVIENTFHILVARRSIFNTPINDSVENVEKYVNGTVTLLNYLRQTENAAY